MTLQNSGSNDGQIHMMMSLVGLMKQLMRNIASLNETTCCLYPLHMTLDLIILLNQNHLKLTTVLVTAKMTFHLQLCLNFINASHLITQLHQFGHAVFHVA